MIINQYISAVMRKLYLRVFLAPNGPTNDIARCSFEVSSLTSWKYRLAHVFDFIVLVQLTSNNKRLKKKLK